MIAGKSVPSQVKKLNVIKIKYHELDCSVARNRKCIPRSP